jgi:ketosteroid isomerase-like protein
MTTAEEKVERFTETFLDAYNAGDAAGAASFYAENAVYMPMHHPAVAGRPEIESYHRKMMAQFSPTFSLTPEETIESGGLIVQRGGYIVLLEQGDGGVVEDAGKYVIVCEESSEGALQILWDIDNSDFPAA